MATVLNVDVEHGEITETALNEDVSCKSRTTLGVGEDKIKRFGQ